MISKEGVVFIHPHPAILHALNIVDLVWRKVFAKQATVTSGSEGRHSATSYHYGAPGDVRERGVDIRTFDLVPDRIPDALTMLGDYLGEAYDVILEGNHIHIEYDVRELER